LFAREYIIKRTSHPTATGGSPIVTVRTHQPKAVQPSLFVVIVMLMNGGSGYPINSQQSWTS
jgi:indoleamine 2,3-dioxygenase